MSFAALVPKVPSTEVEVVVARSSNGRVVVGTYLEFLQIKFKGFD
jgi:hypothetical protein